MPLSCPTRWSSHYNQALFAQKYKLQIESRLEFAKSFPKGPDIHYTPRDWENTDAVVSVLKIMRDAVTLLQGDFITNSMMPMLSSMLHAFIMRRATSDLPDHIQIAALDMFDSFGDRFEVCTDASKIASFLDPRSKDMHWADERERDAIRLLTKEATFDMVTRGATEKEKEREDASGGSVSGSTEVVDDDEEDENLEDSKEECLLYEKLLVESEMTADITASTPANPECSKSQQVASRKSMAEFEVSQYISAKALKKRAPRSKCWNGGSNIGLLSRTCIRWRVSIWLCQRRLHHRSVCSRTQET